MRDYLVTLALILLVYAIYKLWIKPLKIINCYVKQLKNMGYNVLEVPYNPFKNDMITTLRKGEKQGDALKIQKQERCKYDVIVSNTLNRPRIQFHHPDFMKDFFSVDKHFDFPKTTDIVNVFSTIAGHGLFFSEGESWRRKRIIFNKIFNFDFLKAQTFKIAQISSYAIKATQETVKRQQNQNQNQFQYPIIQLTTRIFSNVMMEIFLGGAKDQLIQSLPVGIYLKKLLSQISAHAFTPINFLLGPKFIKLGITKKQRQINSKINIYREWGLSFIRKRIAQIQKQLAQNPQKTQPEDIIQALLMAKNKADPNSGENFSMTSQTEIFEQFTSFFIAGTDTTSNYTQMMIYEVARHPEIEASIRNEIDKYMKDDDYSYDNLKKFKYIQIFQKEVTRTYGPINNLFSRRTKHDTILNGLPIRKNTGVSMMFTCNHFSDKYFNNPLQFKPERWDNQCDQIPTYAFSGFGGGARTCIGKHLAMLQSKIALIKFLKRYKKIILPNNNFKMLMRFTYIPEQFKTKMIANDGQP